jgi:hypothetical protein
MLSMIALCWHLVLTLRMAQKKRYTVSLPAHVTAEVDKRARSLGASPTEYACDVIRWWFGQGCPSVRPDEEQLRRRPSTIEPGGPHAPI